MQPVDLGADKVVSITVSAKWRGDKMPCEHLRVEVDRALAMIKCRDCGEGLNPIEWIATLGLRWQHVERARARYEAARAAYEARTKARCEHCHRMTRLRPMTPAEIDRFTRAKS